MSDIYKKAVLRGLTFPTQKGVYTLVDVAQLRLEHSRPSVVTLATVGNALLLRRSKMSGVSILGDDVPSPEAVELDLQIELIRDLVALRKAQKAAAQAAALKQSRKAELGAIIAERKAKEAPIEELEKAYAELG